MPLQLAQQLLVLRLLKYHLDSASELMKNEPKERQAIARSSFGSFRTRSSPVNPAPVQNEPVVKAENMLSKPDSLPSLSDSIPLTSACSSVPAVSKPKSRQLYSHLRVRVRRRRTFSNRHMWRMYLRRCRERFLYKQLGKISRHHREQYGRLLARYSLYHLRRVLLYERENVRLRSRKN